MINLLCVVLNGLVAGQLYLDDDMPKTPRSILLWLNVVAMCINIVAAAYVFGMGRFWI